MTDQILNTIEQFPPCPYDGKILPFYEGTFEAAYIMLHPFLKPVNLAMERFCSEEWPTKQEIVNGCMPIKWQEVLRLAEFSQLADIDVGLRTSIGGLVRKSSREDLAEKLITLQDEHDIIHPSEGELPPLLENRLLMVIKEMGYDQLWVGDEFGEEIKLHWIDDLFKKDEIPYAGCVFTRDHSLLVTTHWDSHCSFLCSSKETIENVLSREQFEGFYCTAKTEVYWGLHEAT